MICIPIVGPTYELARAQITAATASADLLELRLDLLTQIDLTALRAFLANTTLPILFTLRSRQQGGACDRSLPERCLLLHQLAALRPAYMDLESDLPISFTSELSATYSKIKWIFSHHNHEGTPQDLDALLRTMQHPNAFCYKIAVMAQSSLDTLRLLTWAKNKNVIPISMGPLGQVSRVLAPVLSQPGITFACLDDVSITAPGQLSATTLKDIYRYSTLSPSTAIYGLIGQPIDRSIGHLFHNKTFRDQKIDAVYVKIAVNPEELAIFLEYAKKLPFQGLSVTMPLKELIIPYLDQIEPMAKQIGAVNTLAFSNEKIIGYNTDGAGALEALETLGPVAGKRLLIVGAGGAARAIAFVGAQRRASVVILNRSKERAEELADAVGGVGAGLDQMHDYHKQGYDILVNTTPLEQPIDPTYILPNTIYMDINTKHTDTPLIAAARSKGCVVAPGYQMFVNQAAHQYQLWFGRTLT